MDYYDKMEGPTFTPISVQNAIIKHELSPDVKNFLSEEWKKLNEKGQHQCPFVKDEIRCKTTFSGTTGVWNMRKHYQQQHTTAAPFQCKVCPCHFDDRIKSEDHVVIKHMCKS